MVYINLLPIKEIKKRAQAQQQLMTFAIALVGLLAVIAMVGFYQINTVSQLQDDLVRLNKEKHQYTNILNQIKKFEQDKILIEKKIAVIKELRKSSALTVHVLDEVANLTPTKRLWIKSLSQSGNSLRLTGMALDNRTIAQYMEDLKTSPYISEVNLAKSSLSQFAGRNLKSFSLSCTISVPESDSETNKK